LQAAGIWETSRTRKWDSIYGAKHTALEIARKKSQTKVVSLLGRFVANPSLTRHELRVKLEFPDALAAEVFALTVFMCDDLLQLKRDRAMTTPPSFATDCAAIRFFGIIEKLPMELQMILCHRAVDSANESILSKDSEGAFQ